MIGSFYPDTLKALNIWTLWRLEPDKNGRMTKVPYSPHYDGRASSTKPETWGSFSQALQKYESKPGFYAGLAIAVVNGLVFTDIDHCIDNDGVMNETASDIVSRFNDQYVEISQSGTGIHIITCGTIPRNFKNSKNNVEMYGCKRFCSMTGNPIHSGEPSQKQAEIDYVFQRYKTSDIEIKPLKTRFSGLRNSDKWVIQHASGHGRFDSLYAGNWQAAGYNSQSEADLALCVILAFWTDCDSNQIDRIFRSSGLYREKWNRNDYREKTIIRSLNLCTISISDYIKEKGEDLERELSEQWDR